MNLTGALLLTASLGMPPGQLSESPARRECGEVVQISGEQIRPDRKLLAVERGFNWERGAVELQHFELLAGNLSEPTFESRRQLIGGLSGGEKVCILGRVISRPHRVPVLIPDVVETFGHTAHEPDDSSLF